MSTRLIPSARTLRRAALSLSLLGAPAAFAQSAVVGTYGNFDAANYEGKNAYGFEIQIEGLQPQDLGPSWTGNMFGTPEVVPYATGIYVRYKSPWDGTKFTAATVPHAPGTAFAGTCYPGYAGYATAGCDHFGVHPVIPNPQIVAYRWMFPDPANPGQLVAGPNNIFVPTPVYYYQPPAQPAEPPVLVAEVDLPDPPQAQYGDATWMKVYKSEADREVTLEELTADNPLVTAATIETEWDLVQPSPPGGHKQRGKHTNQNAPASSTHAVIRRYETYRYTGAYDPATHEALCGGDGSCSAPQTGELGDMLVAQMDAVDINVPGITVTLGGTGSGSVSSSDKAISCGSKCSASYALNTVVTLSVKPASNNSFTGWSGACTGTATTCNVTIRDAMTTTASFAPIVKTGGGGGSGGGTTQYTLQVGSSNSGTVTSAPVAINCGKTCSAKFDAGTAVTLTATPASGKTFLGWSGACVGTTPVCTVTMSANLSTTASFSK